MTAAKRLSSYKVNRSRFYLMKDMIKGGILLKRMWTYENKVERPGLIDF